MISPGNKGARLLDLYERFSRGALLTKAGLAALYGVNEKTIQRDIDDLRAYLAESAMYSGSASIRYDAKQKGYVLSRSEYEHLNHQEVLAIAKVLLESRAFEPEEMHRILEKILSESAPENRGTVEAMVKNEAFLYVPLRHGKALLSRLWELSEAIRQKEIVSFSYRRMDGEKKTQTVKPVAVLFSEFYFYLVAFTTEETHDYPYTFRLDRMENVKETGNHFSVPYSDRFNEGEFRKRVQFMYAGPLHVVKFLYKGPSVEAVLDRLPTAEILKEENGTYTLRAEAYGKGIYMWLDSQGDKVEILEGAEEKGELS